MMFHHRLQEHRHQGFDPLFDPRTFTPEAWCAMSEEEFHDRFAQTPMTRSGLARIKKSIR